MSTELCYAELTTVSNPVPLGSDSRNPLRRDRNSLWKMSRSLLSRMEALISSTGGAAEEGLWKLTNRRTVMYCTLCFQCIAHIAMHTRLHVLTHTPTHIRINIHTHARTLAYTTHTCSWFFITLLSVPLPDLVCIRRINKRKLTIPSLLRKPFLRYNNKKHLKHSFFRGTLNFTMLF